MLASFENFGASAHELLGHRVACVVACGVMRFPSRLHLVALLCYVWFCLVHDFLGHRVACLISALSIARSLVLVVKPWSVAHGLWRRGGHKVAHRHRAEGAGSRRESKKGFHGAVRSSCTHTTICLRPRRGLRMNLRVRRVTGVSLSAILTCRLVESKYCDRVRGSWRWGGRAKSRSKQESKVREALLSRRTRVFWRAKPLRCKCGWPVRSGRVDTLAKLGLPRLS